MQFVKKSQLGWAIEDSRHQQKLSHRLAMSSWAKQAPVVYVHPQALAGKTPTSGLMMCGVGTARGILAGLMGDGK